MPNDSDSKDQVRKLAGDGLQGLGGLCRAFDIGHPVAVKGRRRGDDNGDGNDVRKSHTDERIGADARKGRRRLMVGELQRRTFRFDPDILGFLGGLPEKEIRRDCRAGYSDHCR